MFFENGLLLGVGGSLGDERKQNLAKPLLVL